MVKFSKTDPGTFSTFKMELLITINNGKKLQRASFDGLTTNGQYLHVAHGNSTTFTGKIKIK